MRHRGLVVLLLLLFTTAGVFLPKDALAQGDTGFLRGKGKTDAVFSYSRDYYDKFWIGSGGESSHLKPGHRVSTSGLGTIRRTAQNLYAAYGITDDMDIVGTAAYVESDSSTQAVPTEEDLQDATLTLKWRLLNHDSGGFKVAFLLAPGVKIPMTRYENDTPTAIGDGQEDFRARGILHLQFGPCYLAIESGYDVRSDTTSNEIPFNATAGVTVAERVTISPFFSLVDQDSGSDIGDPNFHFYELEEDFARWGVSLYLRLSDCAGISGMWRTTLSGRNTGDTDSWALGAVLRF